VNNANSEKLRDTLAHRPKTWAIVQAVLSVWPEHADYLAKNFVKRSAAMLEAGEYASAAVLKLAYGALEDFAIDYRWTCDRLRDEEIFFHREERYRLATFAEALAEVYSDHGYMTRYMHGLLLSQVLWYNHVGTLEMFLERVLGEASSSFDYLEVGPGHGLMTHFAAQSPLARSVTAWDVSEASLRETRAALDTLGTTADVALDRVDILSANLPDRQYGLVVISEVLEHLEAPHLALRFLHQVLAPSGRIFINVPINSPSPDHIYLLSSPDEVAKLVQDAGFAIDRLELFATQGRDVQSALRQRISISAGVVAHRAN
jgi:2-polyprenyl-3-methyl-5-hydroxy-6-metoxy-1,4-benzoquinol methylase